MTNPTDPKKNSLKSLKNKYKGKRAFIIGNGPSLNRIAMEKLAREYTFSFNRAYIAYEQWGFKPNFFVSTDDVVVRDNFEEINGLIRSKDYENTEFFLPLLEGLTFELRPNFYPLDTYLSNLLFDENVDDRFARMGDVAAATVQLAVYMGFREILLVGVDANYTRGSRGSKLDHGESENVGWTAYESETDDDPDHFIPNYFGKGRKFSEASSENHIRAWEAVKRWVDIYNDLNPDSIRILDLTRGGKLPLFEKGDYDDYLAGKTPPVRAVKESRDLPGAVVFGTGQAAWKFLDGCSVNYNVLYFVDNNKKRWGREFFGLKIKNPAELRGDKVVGKVVVAVQDGMNILEKQLTDLGVYGNAVCYRRCLGEMEAFVDWSDYAGKWKESKGWVSVEDPGVPDDKKDEYLQVLGDEWGDRESVRRVLSDYIFPHIDTTMQVAEIGCGGGRIAAQTVELCKHLHCFDSSAEMISVAEESLAAFDNKTFYLTTGNRLAPPLEARSVDFAYSFDVMVHLEPRIIYRYMQELNKVLKPGSLCFLHFATMETRAGWDHFTDSVRRGVTNRTLGTFEYMAHGAVERFAHCLGFQILRVSEEDESNYYYKRDRCYLLKLKI